MTEHAITYQDRLRRARLDAGLDQAHLADATGISRSTISAVEAGKRDLTAPKLFAWARATGAPLDWIAGELQPRLEVPDEALVPLFDEVSA